MTQTIALLGYPLGHSISPAFQQAALDALGIPARYVLWETRPDALLDVVARLRGHEYLGANVTVPYKEQVLPLLDHVLPDAAAVGAVNTIVHRDGALEGHNTDAYGFTQGLVRHAGFEPAGRRVLLVGAGGAARGVVLALSGLGVARITIANRTAERAEVLAALARQRGVPVEVVPWQAAARAARSADLIVNTTTLGMAGGPAPDASPLPAAAIPAECLVFDLVYNPRETPLLRAARSAGARTLDGLPMLVYQGAAAFKLWTGKEPPVDLMLRAAETALAAWQAHP